MSTSVTKRFKRSLKSYLGLSLFLLAFGFIYEHFSYGQTSPFMHWAFLIPLLGGGAFLLALKIRPATSRLSMNLWNSSLAIFLAGFLFRGIVNLSGRSTSLDNLFWGLGACYILLTIISMLFTRSTWEDSIK